MKISQKLARYHKICELKKSQNLSFLTKMIKYHKSGVNITKVGEISQNSWGEKSQKWWNFKSQKWWNFKSQKWWPNENVTKVGKISQNSWAEKITKPVVFNKNDQISQKWLKYQKTRDLITKVEISQKWL